MGVLEIIGSVFMAIGALFALTGSVGVLRMPDFYSRLHPAGKSDTLAQALILLGLALFAGQQLLDTVTGPDEHGGHGDAWLGLANIMVKLVLLTALLFLTAPTATHAIAKAARLDRYTRVPVENDPGASRVAEIVVAGDVGEQLEETAGPVLDVGTAEPQRAEPEPEPEEDEP
ncbi:Na(+)/H(+) antiporter subunit G [Enhygromyxa salina]|uniref:Na(+)/H(+) antiporter subunit G n=1 Tax=Enhygromyxa salina TaxID=215803 RepID=A0A2S9XY24_9BACT|nr:monovalent cation/H(+) antiporter subunit G [Enhygromyxa salina]PRP97650.1 Na(+)/H(+) antiporter subunit G [Enhygromyxa salina]